MTEECSWHIGEEPEMLSVLQYGKIVHNAEFPNY